MGWKIRHLLTDDSGREVAFYDEVEGKFEGFVKTKTCDMGSREDSIGKHLCSHEDMRSKLSSLAEEYAVLFKEDEEKRKALADLEYRLYKKYPDHCPDCGGTGGSFSYSGGGWYEPPCVDFDECGACTSMGIDPLDTNRELGEDGMTVSGVSIDNDEAPLDPLLEEIRYAESAADSAVEAISLFHDKLYNMSEPEETA